MKTRFLVLGAVVLGLALVQPLRAATTTGNVAVSATISGLVKLTIGSATVTFANADPDTMPSIAATEGAINITAKARTTAAGSVTLTAKSGGDLVSGGDTILIGGVTWTASGTGYVAGTMNKTTDQAVGSWTGSGTYAGTQSYVFANSWSYATGSYTATVTYTLTAP
jgi:hypothetical protein